MQKILQDLPLAIEDAVNISWKSLQVTLLSMIYHGCPIMVCHDQKDVLVWLPWILTRMALNSLAASLAILIQIPIIPSRSDEIEALRGSFLMKPRMPRRTALLGSPWNKLSSNYVTGATLAQ
jgi:hypothetical protein